MTWLTEETETIKAARGPVADTSYTDIHDPNFPATAHAVCWRVFGARNSAATEISRVYKPTREAAEWDLGRDFVTDLVYARLWAKGNQRGDFSYVLIDITGRKASRVTGYGFDGLRCRVTFNLNTIDESRDPGWFAENYFDAGRRG